MTSGFQGDAIVKCRDRVCHATGAGRAEEFGSHDLRIPVYTDDTSPVIAAGCYDARNVRSMSVIVKRIPRPRDGVNPVYVIYKAISIVIDAITGCFSRIAPHVCVEIRMIVINASINN